jgi:hypothetical protein
VRSKEIRALVRVERPRSDTAIVWLEDPENHNALSGVLTVQLKRALEAALADPALRAVISTGRYQFGGIARLIPQSDKPLVVALNGPVAGVALAWTLSSDLVIGSERAQLVPAREHDEAAHAGRRRHDLATGDPHRGVRRVQHLHDGRSPERGGGPPRGDRARDR